MPDPAPGFLDYLLSGQYLPAIGAALILIVAAARAGLSTAWPWFATRTGGYVLGFGSATLLYVGEALRSGAGVTVGVLAGALAAGWAASGGFEMVRDLLTAWRRPRPPTPIALLVVALVALVSCSSCKELQTSTPPAPVAAVIDCTQQNRDRIDALGREMLGLVGERPDWRAVLGKAVNAGVQIGGCALAELVQGYLAGRKAVPVDESWRARETLELYRERHAGGATFKTAAGEL